MISYFSKLCLLMYFRTSQCVRSITPPNNFAHPTCCYCLLEEISACEVEMTFKDATFTTDSVKLGPLVQKLVFGARNTNEHRRLVDLINLLIRPHVRTRVYAVCVFNPNLHPEHARTSIKHNCPVVIHRLLTVDYKQL